jgi:tRNA(Ile)-lysidine synthetase-like protein
VDPAAWRVHVRPLATVPSPVPPARGGPDRWELVCPADALQGGLHVRAARAGERLRPLGRGGTRKLSDLFQESRVAASHRAAVPVVADDAGPLWVPGVVQDERTRVLPSCRQALTIILERRRSDPVT